MQIVLQPTTPRHVAAAGRISGQVIQVLRSLGTVHVAPQRLEKLKCSVAAAERRTLLDNLTLAPGWQQGSEPNKSVTAIVKTPVKLVGRVGLEPTTKGL